MRVESIVLLIINLLVSCIIVVCATNRMISELGLAGFAMCYILSFGFIGLIEKQQ